MSRLRVDRRRDGFAMLVTLWVMSVAAVIAMAAALVGRRAVTEGASRTELERARWLALACAYRAEATIDGILSQGPTLDDAAQAWRVLDQRVRASSSLIGGCDVRLSAAGTQLDVNSASQEMLGNLFAAIGHADQAPELAAAIVDWRDTDDVALPGGAERAWYAGAGRIGPRNGPIADVRELRRIKGLETMAGVDSVIGTERGRVSLATAPVSVLMAVPGITRETAERIVALQVAGTPVADLLAVTASISEESTEALSARYPEASRETTADPDAWVMTIVASRGLPPVSVRLDWRLVRTGRTCLVAATRSAL